MSKLEKKQVKLAFFFFSELNIKLILRKKEPANEDVLPDAGKTDQPSLKTSKLHYVHPHIFVNSHL